MALKGESFNILGDHFHPILITIAPLYWLWDDPRVLLLVQAGLIAASCIFVWSMARRRFTALPSSLIVVAYGIGWPIQGMVDFDFHEIAFALPLLGWAINAIDTKKDWQLLAACLLLLLVREDMGAIVLMIGLVRALQRPRWVGITLAALGLVGFLLVVGVVIPSIGGEFGYWHYSVLGDSVTDAAKALVVRPHEIFAAFFMPVEKTWTLLALLGALLLLPLGSPYALISLPLLAQRFLSDRSALWSTEFHYTAPIWVILVMAAIPVLDRVTAHAEDAAISRGRRQQKPYVRQIITALLAAIPLAATLVFQLESAFPLARMVNGVAWKATDRMPAQQAAVDAIPADACITADDRLALTSSVGDE